MGGRITISCYNITSTAIVLPHDSLWYKIASNGTLQPLPMDLNSRVISDVSQLRISSARNEDAGFYCCKGPLQALDECDDSATANVTISIPPVINPGQNQTVVVRSNAIIECIIEHVGNPPFVAYRWEKSGHRLVPDGTKYIIQLIGNRMFLHIVNSTTEDEGYYQCILETSGFEIQDAFVFLSVNNATRTHMELTNGGLYCKCIETSLGYVKVITNTLKY